MKNSEILALAMAVSAHLTSRLPADAVDERREDQPLSVGPNPVETCEARGDKGSNNGNYNAENRNEATRASNGINVIRSIGSGHNGQANKGIKVSAQNRHNQVAVPFLSFDSVGKFLQDRDVVYVLVTRDEEAAEAPAADGDVTDGSNVLTAQMKRKEDAASQATPDAEDPRGRCAI
ncbi:hypothetical protein VFPPC_18378 [Pochonia chlamydosporia 170]|uniref:Uncharacterized protein n=1 Tax=Pochonia chlamydosporia 170 TaxID=1380566 RepID=A0A219ANM3_METCM|nr:hypothetical protein VFPPC_18378 [Pochonia chlamydosporia 170]OWT42437.1 hypothetical protein VFPPC_18378 [Pochonia chlamydosporia 170]